MRRDFDFDAPVTRVQFRLNLAEKLFDTVAAPVQLGEIQLTVRASIGIALTPHDGCTADTLLHHADLAMYQAKRQQSRYVFFDAMTAA